MIEGIYPIAFVIFAVLALAIARSLFGDRVGLEGPVLSALVSLRGKATS